MAESIGALSKLLFDESTIDTMSIPLSFISSTLKATRESVNDEGTRGTLSRSKERESEGLTRVGGNVVCTPSPTVLNSGLLDYLTGSRESVDVWALADAPLPVNAAILNNAALVDAGMFTYTGLVPKSWEFSGSQGSKIKLTIDWLGKTRTPASGAGFPSVALDTDGVYVFAGGVLTAQAATRKFSTFRLSCDFATDADFNNSLTADYVDWLDRNLILETNMPWTAADGEDIFDKEFDTYGGAAASLVFVSNLTGQSLTFTMGNIRPATLEDVTIGGKTRIRFPITYKCLKSGSTSELTITNDPVV